MTAIPAVCNSCGTHFVTRSLINAGPNVRISFRGTYVGPCPNCGGLGRVPDGIFEVVHDAIRLIVSQDRGRDDMQRLTSVLADARRAHAEPAEVIRRLDDQAPEWHGFSDFMSKYVLPKNAGEFWTIIGVIIAIVAVFISMGGAPMDEKTITTVVQKAVAQEMQKAAAKAENNQRPLPRAQGAKRAKTKIGRNDRCPCNSGKKYKMCCLNRPTAALR